MKNHGLEEVALVTLGLREEMISFLQDRIVPAYNPEATEPKDLVGKYVFTDQVGIDYLKSENMEYDLVETFPDFRITVLNGTFLNKKTRQEELEMKFLVKVGETSIDE
jgi:hypothetical protein